MSIPSHLDQQQAAGPGSFDPEKLEVAPGRKREGLEGWVPELVTESELREALEKAFDYRGDVTLTRKDGSKVEGYLFDRVTGPTLSASFIRILPKDGGARLKIAYAEIAALAFTGRDTAAGKSWEAWVRKYWEKKGSGEAGASLHPDTAE
ncbi:MAG TPA: hypothetical protein VMT51_09555 [Dongiaceae bacterium]|nr:hypothetical protein [Dongiaceae bacterium]